MYEAKPLKYTFGDLKGISYETIFNHYDKLYKGYVNKFNEVQEKIELIDPLKGNASYSEWRSILDAQGFVIDAILLHELYFENLGGNGSNGGLEIKTTIAGQFGSLEAFQAILKGSGMASRGWVVVAINPLTEKIDLFQCDWHNQGGIWLANPILVLDVYEHAYFIDHGADKAKYLDAFWENIDWTVVNQRYTSNIG